MKAKCTRRVRLNGLQFEPGEEYFFEEQVFSEEYNPAIHPRPARGCRIRYIRYKATLPMPFSFTADPNEMVEVRTVYFYDRSYCEHHDWKDEHGQITECFENHFSAYKDSHNVPVPALKKKPLWPALPKKINENPMEMPEGIIEYMKRNWREQIHQMFGGLSPNDWDYDFYHGGNKHE